MSLNAFMHSRNIYRKRPDFAEMAKTYASFAPFVRHDSRGKVVFDYNDCHALRQLTITLLKKDFDLEVRIPADRLIPTVPQRLNYILFVEDLVSKLKDFLRGNGREVLEVIGVDVGTGCCAVFPLIGCTLNKDWSFVAIDVDPVTIESAVDNINRNHLNPRIKVIECNEETGFAPIVQQMSANGQRIHFLMTNPPFFEHNYSDEEEDEEEEDIESNVTESKAQMDCTLESGDKPVFKSKVDRKRALRHKSSANTSKPIESVVSGGEVEFVSKIIENSLQLKDKVLIYSSMLGKKSSLKQLKSIIKSEVQRGLIHSFVCTEFCQGLTKRWGIAWTLVSGLNLRDVAVTKAIKPKPPLVYYLPPLMKSCEYTIDSVSQRIQSLLKEDLKLDSFDVKKTRKRIEFRIRSQTNVWSNQRKRRREMKRQLESQSMSSDKSDNSAIDDQNGMNISANNESKDQLNETVSRKRGSDDMDCDSSGHELSMNAEAEYQTKKCKTSRDLLWEQELYLLDTSLAIRRDKQTIIIEMETKELATNSESTHQLFQYFKNNLN
ncbi:unnamed protein product [Medioppia subpectinata]|uniref:U6 small nuclear RNA (adenine-(43)-N(6))-methyltransferase n=1 Tax=Medioppia subpectinata TaxID=1979941 RepID=A0A7R9L2I1_9ACAR|nr:unnamed protein product [Medioppia subpectinata]CAG2113206.1 unnamed protein product [Medioppia subpectinata]